MAMPVMELEDTEDTTSSDESEDEESESEFSESIGDVDDDDDDDEDGGDDGDLSCSGYTTGSSSCGSFLEGVEQDFIESFSRDKTQNALAREEATKRRASLNALDMLRQAAGDGNDKDDGGGGDPKEGQKRRQLAKQNSMKSIMDRMQKSNNFYFQAPPPKPTQLRRCVSDPLIMCGSDDEDEDDEDADVKVKTAVVIENPPAVVGSGTKVEETSTPPVRRRKSRRTSSFAKGGMDESFKGTTTTPTVIDYGQSPEDCLKELLNGISHSPTSDDYFLAIDAARLSRYSPDVAKAVRAQDIDKLRKLEEEDGICFDACNSQGESLVHLACRRRNLDLLRFLVKEANVSLKVRDDWGKSPLHELCWNGQPSKGGGGEFFPGVKLVLEQEPQLLFAKDKRGFCPCQYVPKDHWKEWCSFLKANKRFIRFKVQYIGFARSRDQLRKTLELAQAALVEYSSQ